MDKKNVKVSEIVYDKLEAKKRSGETFNDTLRRIMKIYPELEDLIAYLPDRIRDYGKEIVELIEQYGEFRKEIKKDDIVDELHFIDKEEGITISKVKYGENGFRFVYRNKNGDMKIAGPNVHDKKSYEKVKKQVKKKVPGATRRWGSSNPTD